jgi:NADPH-dependent 2,4-dienoyl-CoA reductase/sulfur reductase-like enzyme
MMENLWELGIHVSLVEMSDQVMAPIDFEMAQSVHAHIDMHNVNLILSDGVKAFENNGSKVRLNSGKVLDTDMTILSIGVTPENELATDAELEDRFPRRDRRERPTADIRSGYLRGRRRHRSDRLRQRQPDCCSVGLAGEPSRPLGG